MLFVIQRISLRDNTKQPCKNAFKTTIPNWDVRKYSSPKEFDKLHSKTEGLWLDNGTNHSITKDGNIARINGKIEIWGIEISLLNELLELQDKEGNLIIIDYWYPEELEINLKEILIYDDYYE